MCGRVHEAPFGGQAHSGHHFYELTNPTGGRNGLPFPRSSRPPRRENKSRREPQIKERSYYAQHTQKEYIYQVDKITFIVTPVYKENGESMRDILLKLMLSELEN